MAQKWSAPFTRVTSTQTLCLLHTVNDPYSGVINNQAKGLNYVLKQLQEWKEEPVDCMILALHYLQGYYQVEIALGHQGLGNYGQLPLPPYSQNCLFQRKLSIVQIRLLN